MGRAIQTQQLTPDCPGYIKVDTTYDSAGRTASVSNPYCLTSEATYGIVQTQYDALSRAIKTIKQDGSATTVQYNAAAGDGSGSSVICTTAIDEGGRQRQVCSDALDRMTKVLEPDPSAPATNSTGWVTISGTEQTANSQPANAASVTVTIGGTDSIDSTTVCARTCITTNRPDTGTMQFTVVVSGATVGPVSVSGGYNGSSTPQNLAAACIKIFLPIR